MLAVIFGTVKQEALELVHSNPRCRPSPRCASSSCIQAQLTWVVTADPYGPDNERTNSSSDTCSPIYGQQYARAAVGGLRGGAFVSAIGHQEIPVAYGASFAVLAGPYTVAYFGFLVGVILALIGLIGKDSKSPDPAPVRRRQRRRPHQRHHRTPKSPPGWLSTTARPWRRPASRRAISRSPAPSSLICRPSTHAAGLVGRRNASSRSTRSLRSSVVHPLGVVNRWTPGGPSQPAPISRPADPCR